MPGRDQTGPQGAGPFTGRGFGNCSNNPVHQTGNGLGRMRGFRRAGRGSGRGFGFNPVPTVLTNPVHETQNLDMLKSQAAQLQEQLNNINQIIQQKEDNIS